MSVIYMAAGLVVIVLNAKELPADLRLFSSMHLQAVPLSEVSGATLCHVHQMGRVPRCLFE